MMKGRGNLKMSLPRSRKIRNSSQNAPTILMTLKRAKSKKQNFSIYTGAAPEACTKDR